MRLIRVVVNGLPLFKDNLDINFYVKHPVTEDEELTLYKLCPGVYLNTAVVFAGINASGKTSVLRVLSFILKMLRNDPINYIEENVVLGALNDVTFDVVFSDESESNSVCRLTTSIRSVKSDYDGMKYKIVDERLWEKSLDGVTIDNITDFSDKELVSSRDTGNDLLPDDVSIIIGRNKRTQDTPMLYSLLPLTNVNVLPVTTSVSPSIIEFLDPSIEHLYFDRTYAHLKFKGRDELILKGTTELEKYLSSGTIKGITAFMLAKTVLVSGGYLVVDEIENHFNKEIVATLIRFFMDKRFNKRGSSLIFSTHYVELLDEFECRGGVFITEKEDLISVTNLSEITCEDDISISDAYQSGLLGNTAPRYEAYDKMRMEFDDEISLHM